VNKRNHDVKVKVPAGFEQGKTFTVDEATGDSEPRAGVAEGAELTMAPFAVTVLEVP